MNLPALAVDRPVFTVMVTLIAVLLGLVALLRLPVDLLPDIETPALTVSVDYENAAPETMEELVARPVERAVASTPGLEEMISTSAEGVTNVILRFAWGTDVDAAANDVRDRLFSELDELPEDAGRPQLRKFDSADLPILILGISSGIDPIELRRLIDNQLSHRLQQVPGVAAVEVWGGPEREIHIDLDRRQVQALGLSLTGVREALTAANRNLPAGSILVGDRELTLRTPGRLSDLETLRDTVVATVDGAPVRLRQIAAVANTQRRETRLIRIDGEPGVRMGVRKQSGANTVAVVSRIMDEIERLNRDFPQARLTPFFDTSDYIRQSIRNVSRSLLYGSALAVLVLLAFLGSPRATLVVATAIPVSLIATFALVYFNGFTINLMTLGGLALGVGLMVDAAIVVLENVMRRRQELGEAARESAVTGTREIAAAIVASTLTTLAIFVPMLFARELAGELFRQLAIVVAFALVCALLVALTLVPMLAARMVRDGDSPGPAPLRRLTDRAAAGFATFRDRYRRVLDAALARPRTVLAGAGLAVAAAVAALPLIGTEFMPASDEGEVRVSLEMPPGTRLEVLDRQTRRAEAVIRRAVPEAASMVTSVGGSSHRAEGGTEADIRIELVPLAQRDRGSAEIAADLRAAIGALPDTTVRVRVRQPFFLRMLQGGGEAESLQIEVRGYEFATIDDLATRVAERVRSIPGVTDARLPRTGGEPQRLVVVDRARAADLRVSVEDVARTVETAIAGGNAGYFLDDGDEVPIVVKLADNLTVTPAQLLELPVPAADGRRVRLGNVADLRAASGPTVIDRKNQQRLKTVYVNIAGRDLGSVAADVQAALDDIARPANYDLILSGEYEEQVETFNELGFNVLLALLLVYMVMACLYESLRDPLIVMTTVPMALIGVVAALLVTGTTLNAQSLVGCLMLIGIVVNNAILIVDQANLLRRGGHPVADAIREAGRRRLRPILMTAATTMLALLPLAIGLGEGAESQAPLARAVIGGLLSATLITLIVIPVVYAGFHGAWPPRRRGAGASS